MKRKKALFLILIITFIFAVCGCEGKEPAVSPTQTLTAVQTAISPTPSPRLSAAQTSAPKLPLKTTQPDIVDSVQTALPQETSAPAPEQSQQPKTSSHDAGTVRVRPGDTLEKDIIPEICEAFSLSENEVKSIMENCEDSKIIHDTLTDFRRMEGIIIPGKYEIAQDESLAQHVNIWIQAAEKRYDTIASAIRETNNLKPHEQLCLASVIEWECLPNDYYDEVASAFLNRLDDGAKLRSCATTEYALGYTRPYLTSEDIKISSKYNTYSVKGVPIGPICAMEDDCLRAAIAKKTDGSIYYFFNDYALKEILSFSNYEDFKQAAAVSRELYDKTFDIDPFAKVNKKQVFKYDQ